MFRRLTLQNQLINNFIMHNQKSWGVSTKSSSNFMNSPSKEPLKIGGFKLQEAKQRQTAFLREKNQELTDLVLRMGEQIMKLNKDKNELLALNSKYIDTLNKQFKQNHGMFEQLKATENLPKNEILLEFQSDYRNLVRHCINLQQQISSKNGDINELQQIKKELLKSKHTSISQLIDQLIDTTHELINVKKNYNRQEFQLHKITQKYERMMQANKDNQNAASTVAYELENYKSLINTITNQANDKENSYKSKIYSLQLTIQKLEKDVRESQKEFQYVSAKNSILKAEQIEFIQQSVEQKRSINNCRIVRSQSMQKSRKR